MKLYHIFPILILATSCTEDYQLPNPGSQSTIVITGLVTNEPGSYYVTVWEYVSNISKGQTIRRGINDARVTITDSNGNVDELQSFFSVPVETRLYVPYPNTHPDISYYLDYYKIPDEKEGYIEYTVSSGRYGNDDTREGRYFTTTTKGQPGQTYTLKVEHAGKEYTATDYMCYGTVIDSISVEPIGRYIYDKYDDMDGFLVPCLYFAEPQDEVNFYMFKYNGFHTPFDSNVYIEPPKNITLGIILSTGADWPISLASDRFMPPYVYQYKMSDGDHDRKWYNSTDMGFYETEQGWEYGGTVTMYCITEPVYRYYSALSRQYYEDGGAFSPSPASPPTNINGGAQGCFSAASVSQYVLKINK